jgi:Fur family transcriptional regulator, peroxide stress response regulator
MKQLQKQLEAKGVKASYHRLKILDYLDRHRTHPTVDIIYSALQKELPTISKTTIYNSLNLFLEKGLISNLTISGNDVRYDYKTKDHSHFQCKKCGQVIDIEEVRCPKVKNKIEGNEVEEVHLYFKGICKKCVGGNKNG